MFPYSSARLACHTCRLHMTISYTCLHPAFILEITPFVSEKQLVNMHSPPRFHYSMKTCLQRICNIFFCLTTHYHWKAMDNVLISKIVVLLKL